MGYYPFTPIPGIFVLLLPDLRDPSLLFQLVHLAVRTVPILTLLPFVKDLVLVFFVCFLVLINYSFWIA